MLDYVSKKKKLTRAKTGYYTHGFQMKVYTLAWQETWVPVWSSYCFVHTRE